MKILLVDDNVVIRNSFKDLLATIPYVEILGECSDGIEVLPFLNKNKVDVVFMDIIMKTMDGFETTQKIKSIFPNIKVIGFSCPDHTFFVNKMTSCGADGFISKFDANKELIISELKKIGIELS